MCLWLAMFRFDCHEMRRLSLSPPSESVRMQPRAESSYPLFGIGAGQGADLWPTQHSTAALLRIMAACMDLSCKYPHSRACVDGMGWHVHGSPSFAIFLCDLEAYRGNP